MVVTEECSLRYYNLRACFDTVYCHGLLESQVVRGDDLQRLTLDAPTAPTPFSMLLGAYKLCVPSFGPGMSCMCLI